MHPTLLKSASIVIPNAQLLINIVRQRVRQLIRGHRPLIEAAPGMGFCDVALSEVIARKLSYEAGAWRKARWLLRADRYFSRRPF